MNIPKTLTARRELTDKRFGQLVEELRSTGTQDIVASRACVFVTGSVGRGEMSERSDLDLFIARDKSLASPLVNLDDIRLKARLIDAARKLKFPDFSEDGKYVQTYDLQTDFIDKLGTSDDDHDNVLTTRLLLLLESRPILGEEFYKRTISSILTVYWRDFPNNTKDFLPVFLINDILRFWKTLCLNYEERTADAKTGKRRLLNYKLKYSRMLTCYSAIIYLLAVIRTENGTVTTEAAEKMVSIAPTRRLESVAERLPEKTAEIVGRMLENYAKFLDTCDEDKATLQEKFDNKDFKRERFAEGRAFGDEIARLLNVLGEGTELLRYIIV